MPEQRKPTDCSFYPLCKHLEPMVSEMLTDPHSAKTIVLQREAESVCPQCPDFEPKPYK